MHLTEYQNCSDEQLFELVKLGNATAFQHLYDRLYYILLSQALRKVKSKEDAQDLTQDLFMKIWTKRDQDDDCIIGNGRRVHLEGQYILFDKGHIRLTGYIDSLPSYYYRPNLPQVKPIVEGSHAQSMADQLTNMNQKEKKEINVLDQAYMTECYGPSQKEQFNTERGIAILKAIDPLKKQIFERKWNFIKNNPQERVSLDEATYMIMGYGEETLSNLQMDELLTIFDPHWNGKKAYNDLKEMISKARATAIGAKIIDGPLVDQAGNPVQLLSIFPKDKKYILLEFWASWCGPCRGEIPHLRHTYNEWKDKGFDIVSISLDEKEKDWTKAMAEEHMTWNQYNAREGFDSQIAKSYDIQGIPYALLIDSEGRIIKHNMRGASLDQALTELLK